MGRPRGFDPETTFNALYATFRMQGYSGTSLDELGAATGVARPSLYAAFGDKRAMYLRAVATVADLVEDSADRHEAMRLPLEDRLERWFEDCVEGYVAGEQGQGGCLAIGTAAAEAVADPDIRAGLQHVLRVIDMRIARWLAAAEMSDVDGRTALISGLMQSLSLLARAGYSFDELTSRWRASLRLILR